MTITDVRNRWVANRQITNDVAREADLDVLRADIATEWGTDKVDVALREATQMLMNTRR